MAAKPSRHIWYELMTTDPDAAAAFYGAVVGWGQQGSAMPGLDYRMWTVDGKGVGGFMPIPAPAAARGMPPGWFGYLDVADTDAAVAEVTAAGGAVLMPAADIPGIGRIAMVSDPQGAALYVMAPAGEGDSQAFMPGKAGHCGWNELATADGAAALAFYAAQFGWAKAGEVDIGPMGTYLMFGTGGEPVGGIVNDTQGRPRWRYYFNVDDIQAAKRSIEAAGGTVLNGPMVVPGGSTVLQGRDPQGAVFALVQPA